jgi:hypothetical protein
MKAKIQKLQSEDFIEFKFDNLYRSDMIDLSSGRLHGLGLITPINGMDVQGYQRDEP